MGPAGDLARGGRRHAHRRGEWHFGWALGGRAVADVWITPSRAARADSDEDGEWGLSLRFHDPAIGAFRSTWLGPRNHVVLPFTARAADGRIVLDAEHTPGVRTRWQFSEIGETSFHWENMTSTDDGATWTLRQEMHATRPA
ncbi:hypothetical protein ACFQV2_21330 [Actinokineospora soli]|uniref:DUF1579 domain-containing protein n=1 Tax=Actinokineospora soli TaxID=1048753 RepID=A0ABW2TPD1_9PSEU